MLFRKTPTSGGDNYVYRFDRKYNSTLEERIKKTPKRNTSRGIWTGDRGESWYIPTDESIIDILHVFELNGILYEEGESPILVYARR